MTDFSIPKMGSKRTTAAPGPDSAPIKKISGNPNSTKQVPVSMKRKRSSSFFKKTWVRNTVIGLGFFVVLLIVLAAVIAIPARGVMQQAQIVAQKGQEAADAVKSQDLELTKTKLEETKVELDTLQNKYQSMAWTRAIPVVNGYYNDGDHGLKAAQEFITAGQIAVTEIIPYQDLLGFSEGESGFVDQPADKRIETAIATFEKVTPKLSEISEHLDAGEKELSQINPNRYPETFRGQEIRSRIVEGQALADETINLFVNAQPLLEQLPELMGMNGERRYLLLFQNDKELRPSGGFITAYATLIFDKGKMRVEDSSNIYDLDERQRTNIQAPEEILTYHKGVYYAYLRDSNLSPDFKESMLMFEDILENVSNPPKYSGIVAMDTEVLVKTIEVLDGTIFVPEYGENFTVEPDDRCDGCPMVIYELSDYAGRRVNYIKEDRKDIIGKLMFATVQKALGVSPSVYWGPLTQTFIEQFNQKHILVYMHDEEEQRAFESINWAGRIKEYDGDYLHINDANMAGAKSNLFVQHEITHDVDIANDGTVTKTVTIDYRNPSAPSDCNLENEGLCLNGLLRNWLRVYVPEGSELISFEGSETDVVTKEELGKTVFEGFLTVAPKGSSQVVITYKLPFTVEDEYRILVQKQPGTADRVFTNIVNGKKDVLDLETDMELQYPL